MHEHYDGNGASKYIFPPIAIEKEIMLSFDDIYTDLQYVKDGVHDLEHLVIKKLDDDERKKVDGSSK